MADGTKGPERAEVVQDGEEPEDVHHAPPDTPGEELPEDSLAEAGGNGSVVPGVTVDPNSKEGQGPALPYPVVAVGASAGGLPAFREILENLDPATGMTFVMISHLATDTKSFLTEILGRYTRMPVHPVKAGVRPEPNNLYILQPNQMLRIIGGIFQVEDARLPIATCWSSTPSCVRWLPTRRTTPSASFSPAAMATAPPA